MYKMYTIANFNLTTYKNEKIKVRNLCAKLYVKCETKGVKTRPVLLLCLKIARLAVVA